MAVKIKKAIIPVAGLGTRMLPATKAIPKELLTIFDRPIIEHVVQEAIAGGITEIILVTRSGKDAIENHFDAHYELEHRLDKKGKTTTLGTIKNTLPVGVKLTSTRQRDALGLGHAVLCAKHLLNNEPFAVLLPDVLVLDKLSRGKNYSFSQLVRAWDGTGIGQVMVETIAPDRVEEYGIADFGGASLESFESTKLMGVIEKPSLENAPSNFAILGRYILPFKVLDLIENTGISIGDEIQLTDAMDELIKLEALNAFKTDATIFDCGNKQGFLGANVAMGMQDPKVKEYLKNLIETADT
jgi:UTP--glucose-1-phosphate uridylyltransferase